MRGLPKTLGNFVNFSILPKIAGAFTKFQATSQNSMRLIKNSLDFPKLEVTSHSFRGILKFQETPQNSEGVFKVSTLSKIPEDFQKFKNSKNFNRFQNISTDFQKFQRAFQISRNFPTFQEVSLNFR